MASALSICKLTKTYPTGLQALRNIELVAKRSDQRSDEVQAWWCILLHQKLAGLE